MNQDIVKQLDMPSGDSDEYGGDKLPDGAILNSDMTFGDSDEYGGDKLPDGAILNSDMTFGDLGPPQAVPPTPEVTRPDRVISTADETTYGRPADSLYQHADALWGAYETETDPAEKTRILAQAQIKTRLIKAREKSTAEDKVAYEDSGMSNVDDWKGSRHYADYKGENIDPLDRILNMYAPRLAQSIAASVGTNAAKLGLSALGQGEAAGWLQEQQDRMAEGDRNLNKEGLLNEKLANMTQEVLPSLANFAIVGAVTGGAGAVVYVSAQAGNETYLQDVNAGVDKSTALMHGAGAAATELIVTSLFMKYGGGHSAEELLTKAFKRPIGKLTRGFAEEYGEEGIIEIANHHIAMGLDLADSLTWREVGARSADLLLGTAIGFGTASGSSSAYGAFAKKKNPSRGDVDRLLAALDLPADTAEAVSASLKTKDQRAEVAKTARETAIDKGVKSHEVGGKQAKTIGWDEFTTAVEAAALSPNEAKSSIALTAARARAAGLTPDQYVRRRVRAVNVYETSDDLHGKRRTMEQVQQDKQEDYNRDQSLGQRDFSGNVGKLGRVAPGKVRRGSVTMHGDNTVTLNMFRDAQDSSTLIHELGHMFLLDLDKTSMAEIESWAGIKDGKWNRTGHEKWARGLERYLAEGVPPTPQLGTPFRRMKQFMAEVYGGIVGTPIGGEMRPEVRRVMDDMFSKQRGPSIDPKSAALAALTTDLDSLHTFREGEVGVRPKDTSEEGLAQQTAPEADRGPPGEPDTTDGEPDGTSAAFASDDKAQPVTGEKPQPARVEPEDARARGLSLYGTTKQKAKKWFKKLFYSDGLKNNDVAEQEFRKNGIIDGHLKKAELISRRLKKAVDAAIAKVDSAISTPLEASKYLNEALHDPDVMATVPESVAIPLKEMRNHMDQLSKAVKRVTGDEESDLSITIDNNLGFYMTRTYKKFSDPKWKDIALADKGIMRRFAAELREEARVVAVKAYRKRLKGNLRNRAQEGWEKFDPQLDALTGHIRDARKKLKTKKERDEFTAEELDRLSEKHGRAEKIEDKDIQHLAEVLLNNKTRDINDVVGVTPKVAGFVDLLKKRTLNEKPALRELYGENKDAFTNYTESVTSMARFTADKKMLADIRELGLEEGFFSVLEDHNPGHTFSVNHKLPQLAGYKDLLMEEDTADALDEMFATHAPGPIAKAFVTASGAAKANATLYSLTATVRNLIGGPSLMIANGSFNFRSILGGKAAQAIWLADLAGRSDAELDSFLIRMAELGMLEDVTVASLRDSIEHLNSGTGGVLESFKDPHRLNGKIAKLYQSMDLVRKVAMFEDFLPRYQKAFPDMPKNEVEEYVAKIIRDIDPTYSRVGKFVKAWSRYVPLGPFASFNAEIIRTSINRNRLMVREWNSGNPELKKMALRKLFGQAFAMGAHTALAAAIHAALGIGDDEVESVRKRVAPWSRLKDLLIYSWDRESGDVGLIDISYTDPFGILKTPVRALLRGEPGEATKEAFSWLTDSDIFAASLTDAMYNKTRDGREVYDEGMGGDVQSYELLKSLTSPFVPGVVKQYAGILTARDERKLVEFAAVHTGIRTSPFNIEEADSYRNKRYASKYNQSGGSVIQALKYKPLWQLQYRLASAEKKRKKTFDEWVEYAESSTDAGVENVYGNLVEHIGNKQLAKDVFLNRYRPYKPSKATLKWLQRKWRRAKTPQDKEELETRIKGFLGFF